jgi:cytochrome c-type biogenesis protein CcmH/NrfG
MNPFVRLIATIAIVAFVAAVSRSVSSDTQASAESVRCELDPPADIAGLEGCVAQFPSDVGLLIELGDAYQRAGRTAEADEMYRRAAAEDPRDADLQRRLAR